MSKALHMEKRLKAFNPEQIQQLQAIINQVSRGYSDIRFSPDSDIKILITGFDPFLLDRNIKQSNPSGIAALHLDNSLIEHQGKTIEIQAAMFPVLYKDFDQGIVEKVVEPFLKDNAIDLLATISMGRENFDLEHFPGRRRSASAPDNNNLFSGGSADNPVIPKLAQKPLQGPEFVEFSLPYQAMMATQGQYKVNDNRKVTTLEKSFEPNSLEELKGAIAVRGGGGGYLSNEISYRTVNLGNKLGTKVPTGHIHTPRIQEFDKKVIKEIVEQIKGMLVNGVSNNG
jgi:pyrrolidone-carboxylate peptidase